MTQWVQSRNRLELIEWVLVAVGVAAYLVLPHDFGPDGWVRFETTRQLWLGEISQARHSIVQSILALPLYAIGEAVWGPLGAVLRFNTIVFLGGVTAMAVMLRDQIPESLLRRLLLVLLSASMFGYHVKMFFGEVLTAVCVAVGILCLLLKHAVPGYVLVAIGVLNTPAALPAIFLGLLAIPGRQVLRRAVVVTALIAALIMLEFYVRRGSPFLSSYEGNHGPITVMPYSGRPGFSNPLVFGTLAILFSFGKGLAFFVPGLWLLFKTPVSRIPDVLRLFQRVSIWFLIGLVAVYAKWWAWQGDWFWGPRFFLFACFPGAVALAIHLCDERATIGAKALTLAALSWSTWVAVNGVAIGLANLDVCIANSMYLEALCSYTVEFSPLFHPFIVAPAVGLRDGIAAAYFVLTGAVLAAPLTSDLVREGMTALKLRGLEWRRS